MSCGGNKALRDFLEQYDIPQDPPQKKYFSKACKFYRELIKSKVEDCEFMQQQPDVVSGSEIEEMP